MLFVESRFFFFYAVVFSVMWTLRSNTVRKVWLLACSHFFYACFFIGPPLGFARLLLAHRWDDLPAGWWFPLVLIGSTCMDYIVGRGLGAGDTAGRRKAWLLVSLGINLGVLCWFKYFNFFLTSAGAFLAWAGLPLSVHTLAIILPCGVSFYTFQSMSYTIEVYRRHIEPERSFLDLAFFIAFFPQLVAGPIVRSMTFLPQTKQTRRWDRVDARGALVLFLSGFVKKACIAQTVAPYVDHYFASAATQTALSAWLAVLLYAVQIYCDFSGYTDMAIACARLLGYDLTVNFNFPYFARNVTDFWRRWHISLSTWLRDYLYIPLGGNRGSRLFAYRNLMLTMLLGGLWHGAAWGFVIWGAMHGAALAAHREWLRRRGTAAQKPGHETSPLVKDIEVQNPPPRRPTPPGAPPRPPPWAPTPGEALATATTFCFICLCWAWFRAPDFHTAILVTKSLLLFRSGGTKTLDHWLGGLFAILAIIHWLNWKRLFSHWWRTGPDWLFATAYGAAFATALLFVPRHYSAFIYFRF
jgi:alginate O-acetyltransferase complex protein AlgI